MKWIYVPGYTVKHKSDIVNLSNVISGCDIVTGFTEFHHPEFLAFGIRECKRFCKATNSNEKALKKLEKDLRTFYADITFTLVSIQPEETGMYWNYHEETYMFPE